MVSLPSRDRLPALLLVALAFALVAAAGLLVYDDFRPTYTLTATATGDPGPEEDVLSYESLPPAAKAAFDRARDGPHVVHEEPSFRETFPLYDAVYVRADGTVYELWHRSQGLRGYSLLLAAPTLVVAVALGALGVWSYRRRRVRTPLAVLAGLGAAGVAAGAFSVLGPLALGRLPVVSATVAFVVVGGAVRVGLGRVDRRGDRAR